MSALENIALIVLLLAAGVGVTMAMLIGFAKEVRAAAA